MLPALENQPELPDHLTFAWEAFWALHSDRPAVMGGALPIPFSSLDRYARRYGIAGVDAFDRFSRLVQHMDGAYLKWSAEKSKRDSRNK